MIDRVDSFLDGGLAVLGLWTGALIGTLQWWYARSEDRAPVDPPILPVLLSLNGGLWLYACTPDTELARILCGVVAGAGVTAVAARQPWRWGAAIVTVALAYATVFDGAARSSAVIGGLGITAVHVLVQRHAVDCDREARPLVVAIVASAACSRLAGVGDGLSRPLATTVAAVVAAALVLGLRGRPAPSGH